MTYHYYCDRCSNPYETQPGWTNRPLCSRCLIGTRRAETANAWPRPTTSREINAAWRRALFTQWHNEATA